MQNLTPILFRSIRRIRGQSLSDVAQETGLSVSEVLYDFEVRGQAISDEARQILEKWATEWIGDF